MKLSIVICTFNREMILKEVLYRISELNDIEKHEIVIVNNKSTDGTEKIISDFLLSNSKLHIKNVEENKLGLSLARNRGIEESNGDIIAFLDDDAFPCNDWIKEILKAFSIENVVAVGGKVTGRFEIKKPFWINSEIEGLYSLFDQGEKIMELKERDPVGANFAILRSALGEIRFQKDLGRRGTILISGEESYLFKKLRAKGKIYYIPKMLVEHFIHSERIDKNWVLKRLYAGGISEMRIRILNKEKNAWHVLKILIRRIGRIIRYRFIKNENDKFVLKCKLVREKGVIDEFFRFRRFL